jgi:hypothetical protein
MVIINNPCLEYWFLLHFQFTTRGFDNCETVGAVLRRVFNGYEKSRNIFTKNGNDIYSRLKPNLKKAIANSKKVKKINLNDPHYSISEMHLFFEVAEMKQFLGH